MSDIRILPENVSNRIAAGEVVERPASVVKELIENAIDAGATRIAVHARQGGRNLIQVTDNGAGMDRDDAMLAIQAHATSKIRQAEDLKRIGSLGFRGEALASISAVSRFELQTRRTDDVEGVQLNVDGGTLRDVQACGAPAGTTIKVKKLFYNLPARRKFLRTPKTENAHIQETVLLHALANPGIAFELTLDGQTVLSITDTTDEQTRTSMLLGRGIFADLLPVDYEESGIRISGYVSRPGVTRATRREQRIFVNGRPASANSVYYGIRDAYHTLVMKGRFPLAVLYVEIDPERIDVNVHPSKREVRFREEKLVGNVTAAAVRRALQQLAPESAPFQQNQSSPQTSTPVSPETATGVTQEQNFDLQPQPRQNHLAGAGWTGTDTARKDNEAKGSTTAASEGEPSGTPTHPRPQPHTAEPVGEAEKAPADDIRDLQLIGTYVDLYLLARGHNGLVIIDQHAAHERILFEKLLNSARSRDGAQQALLMPATVELTPADANLLENTLPHFGNLGFTIENFGGNTFLVTAVPAHFPQQNIDQLLRDMLDELRESPGAVKRADEVTVAKAACKHAVKREDRLDKTEISQLIRDLADCEMPYTCPHGRPAMINIPDGEIEKRFGRRGSTTGDTTHPPEHDR